MTKAATTTLRSLAGFVAAAASAAGGAPTTVRWAAPVSGQWSQAASWSPSVVPDNAFGGSFHAVIDASGAPYTVTLSEATVALNALTLIAPQATLRLSHGADLQPGWISVFSGELLIDGEAARLQAVGDVVNDGVIRIKRAESATFSGLIFTNHGEFAVLAGDASIEHVVVLNYGSIVATGSAGLTINAGAMLVNRGRIEIGGHNGAICFLNDFTQEQSSALAVGIKTVFPPNMSSGSIEVMGHAALDGALEVYGVNSINPVPGNQWDILHCASRTGDFTSFSFPELDNPEHVWWTEPGETRYRIGVRHIADLDHDGFIGFPDLNILIANFNAPGAPAQGDIDGDGFIGFADLNAILSRFNQSAW